MFSTPFQLLKVLYLGRQDLHVPLEGSRLALYDCQIRKLTNRLLSGGNIYQLLVTDTDIHARYFYNPYIAWIQQKNMHHRPHRTVSVQELNQANACLFKIPAHLAKSLMTLSDPFDLEMMQEVDLFNVKLVNVRDILEIQCEAALSLVSVLEAPEESNETISDRHQEQIHNVVAFLTTNCEFSFQRSSLCLTANGRQKLRSAFRNRMEYCSSCYYFRILCRERLYSRFLTDSAPAKKKL